MNFFERQDAARQKTALLVVLFILATAAIVLAVNAVFYVFFLTLDLYPYLTLPGWWEGKPALYTTLITVSIIIAGSLYRLNQLKSGGAAIARMANALPINHLEDSPEIRRYRNIVEEMAIASGTAVPRMYVMHQESTINAFVAGYDPGEAVIVVTQGALTHLTREELQGVIGHEFSHLLNGDIRINLHLMAILAGLTLIGQTGGLLLRNAGMGRRRYRMFGSGKGSAGFALLGGLLWVIGYIGVWFGRLIKAAISRQREFLADASAIQFTRSPDGLAGALYKIHLFPEQAQLQATVHAEELNHLCFGETIQTLRHNWLASHPPLVARIEAISKDLHRRLKARHKAGKLQLASTPVLPETVSALQAEVTPPLSSTHPDTSVPDSSYIGTPSPVHMETAQHLLTSIPDYIQEALHTPAHAMFIVTQLIQHHQPNTHPALPDKASEQKLHAWISHSLPEQRFPLVEIAIPTLKTLSDGERRGFLEKVLSTAKADGNVSRFEFALICFLERHLHPTSARRQPSTIHSLTKMKGELSIVLEFVVGASHHEPAKQLELLEFAHNRLWGTPPRTVKRLTYSITQLHKAVLTLRKLTPLLKQPVVDVLEEMVIFDGVVNIEEQETLRVLCDVMDCPMPIQARSGG